MKFSIIVPVFNGEKYIKKCILGLCKQIYSNFEIIIIDDNSSDNTINVVKEVIATKKNINITLISLDKNNGAYNARRTGIKKAAGDYIVFVDSDDYIEDDTLSRVHDYLKEDDIDIIKFRYETYPEKIISPIIFEKETVIDNNNLDDKKFIYNLLLKGKKLNNLTTTIIKRKILLDSDIDENLSLAEDFLQCCFCFTKAKKILFVNDILYHYYLHDESTTHSKDINVIKKNINDEFIVSSYLYNFLSLWGLNNQEYNELVTNRTLNEIVDLIFINFLKEKKFNKQGFYDIFNYIYNNSHFFEIKGKYLIGKKLNKKMLSFHNDLKIGIVSKYLKYKFKIYLMQLSKKRIYYYSRLINLIYKVR